MVAAAATHSGSAAKQAIASLVTDIASAKSAGTITETAHRMLVGTRAQGGADAERKRVAREPRWPGLRR
jgi:hypothetical protein